MNHRNYQFGEFFLDAASSNILYQGRLTRLSPRALEILLALILNQGQIVKKDDLLEKVWANSFVEESNLYVQISALRRVLREHETGVRHIETVSGRGYRFLTPVKQLETDIFSALPAKQDEITSIAVLPFINRSKNEGSDYLAEGITDSLISNLSKIAQLKVISYSAVSQFKDQQANLREVGFLLGVDSILTGSMMQIGNDLEISVELVRVSDLAHLGERNIRAVWKIFLKQKPKLPSPSLKNCISNYQNLKLTKLPNNRRIIPKRISSISKENN